MTSRTPAPIRPLAGLKVLEFTHMVMGPTCGMVLTDLAADPALASNNQRVAERPRLLATLRERFAPRRAADLAAVMEGAGLPYAPIRRPEDLYDDPHLLATGGLADLTLSDGERAGQTVQTTPFPFTLDGQRLGVHRQPPRHGEHTDEQLARLGYGAAEPATVRAAGAIGPSALRWGG